ncbi:hypothetical protein [Bacillus haynesii]|uniref:hypothetical protein n=1 Tax=Bacillus haynesii TaxID=1925021 RepID=UPI00227E1531|nr:hypothetical protein [Bacillus haynesii]MCY8758128.1 hypothetical protein [Bacillus haynesii]
MKDERLQIQSLKNIRIAFIFQTAGIFAILLYDMIKEGVMEARNNPLWLLFILTMVVLGWLNLKISVDMYDNAKEQKKPVPYYRIVIFSVLIGTIMALLAKFGPDHSDNIEAFIIGSVGFICFLIPFSFVAYIIRKRSKDDDI